MTFLHGLLFNLVAQTLDEFDRLFYFRVEVVFPQNNVKFVAFRLDTNVRNLRDRPEV